MSDTPHPTYALIVINVHVKALDRLFTYRIPPALQGKLAPGSIVRVPFGPRHMAGIVVRLENELEESLKTHQIKAVEELLEAVPPWSGELMVLAQWMQSYYGCSLLEALRCTLPPLVRISPGGVKKGARYELFIRPARSSGELKTLAGDLKKKAPRQAGFLLWLAEQNAAVALGEARKAYNLTRPVLQEMADKGFLTIEQQLVERSPSPSRKICPTTSLELNEDQHEALELIKSLMAKKKGGALLLHGVTGSGKTEIYLQALQECLSKGKKAIILIPEISLTPQALDRFRGRFGRQVALLHSALSPRERQDEWQRIERGDATVVLGARSALFAPVDDLGLIVIDEEHESSYKQENSPRYHARHIAIKRALYHKALVILGSGTPSLESYYRAREGSYSYIHLPNRVEGRKPPAVHIVDLRRSFNRKGDEFLSPYLAKRAELALSRGGQIILLHNRRGLFNYLLCPECGHIMKCPHCDISLRVHQEPLSLRCHYCFHEEAVPHLCPHCGGFSLNSRGAGTQKIEQTIREFFPGARVLRMDRDSTARRGSHEEMYDTFSAGDADILLGTQMIAKGFDFPRVTLVGVILADVALSLPDFRAGERTYQLLMQVTGRTSRGSESGEVIIQTFNPAHPAILSVARHDMREFYERELEERKELNYPPFLHFIRVLFSGKTREMVAHTAGQFREKLEQGLPLQDREELLGPATAPLSFLQGAHRMHLLIKCVKIIEIMSHLEKTIPLFHHASVQIVVDVDPVSFL